MRTQQQRRVLARTEMRKLIHERTLFQGHSYTSASLPHAWHHVREAIDVKHLFEHYEAKGRVCLSEYPDNDVGLEDMKGDMFCPQVNSDINPNLLTKQEREYEQWLERVGVWTVDVSAVSPDGVEEMVECMAGVEGGLDHLDSGYLVDFMLAGLDALAPIPRWHPDHWVEQCLMIIELESSHE